MEFRFFITIILSIFLIGNVFAVSFVEPLANVDGGIVKDFLHVVPNKVYEISFLVKDEGFEIISAEIKCKNIICGIVEKDGPYFVFSVFKENNVDELINLEYAYKLTEEDEIISKNIELEIKISYDFITVKPLIKSNLEYLEKNELSFLVENTSVVDKNFFIVLEAPFLDEIKEKVQLKTGEKKIVNFDFELLKRGKSIINIFKEIDGKKMFISEEKINGEANSEDIFKEGFFSFLVINPQLNLFNYIKSFFVFLI
jgi:hypothetical protein